MGCQTIATTCSLPTCHVSYNFGSLRVFEQLLLVMLDLGVTNVVLAGALRLQHWLLDSVGMVLVSRTSHRDARALTCSRSCCRLSSSCGCFGRETLPRHAVFGCLGVGPCWDGSRVVLLKLGRRGDRDLLSTTMLRCLLNLRAWRWQPLNLVQLGSLLAYLLLKVF